MEKGTLHPGTLVVALLFVVIAVVVLNDVWQRNKHKRYSPSSAPVWVRDDSESPPHEP